MQIEIQTDIRKSLMLTRETIQSVEILSYNQDELTAFLLEQSERNPLLNIKLQQPGTHSAGKDLRNDDAAPERRAPPGLAATSKPMSGKSENRQLAANGKRLDAGDFNILDSLQHHVGLDEHLQNQLPLLRLRDDVRAVAIHIIGSLERDGYLRRPIWEIAGTLDVTEDAVEAAIAAVQLLEPAGIGARNLRECLRLQLLERGALAADMSILLDNLVLLQRGEIQRLCRLCKVDPDGLAGLLAQLRELDPRPGLAFDTEPVQWALPDILVRDDEAGDLVVELNPALLPKVLIDKAYVARLSTAPSRPEAQDYLRDCLRAANSLIRNLDQRATTTLKIAKVIVSYQEAYFRKGPAALRPLSQKEVATLARVHESTVSRAIANKHIACAHGLVAMKYLLPEALVALDGACDLATTIIRDRIKALVAAESVTNVLSDDTIVRLLAKEGVQIARRTVAKYRAMADIPSSADRRRLLRTRTLM